MRRARRCRPREPRRARRQRPEREPRAGASLGLPGRRLRIEAMRLIEMPLGFDGIALLLQRGRQLVLRITIGRIEPYGFAQLLERSVEIFRQQALAADAQREY